MFIEATSTRVLMKKLLNRGIELVIIKMEKKKAGFIHETGGRSLRR